MPTPSWADVQRLAGQLANPVSPASYLASPTSGMAIAPPWGPRIENLQRPPLKVEYDAQMGQGMVAPPPFNFASWAEGQQPVVSAPRSAPQQVRQPSVTDLFMQRRLRQLQNLAPPNPLTASAATFMGGIPAGLESLGLDQRLATVGELGREFLQGPVDAWNIAGTTLSQGVPAGFSELSGTMAERMAYGVPGQSVAPPPSRGNFISPDARTLGLAEPPIATTGQPTVPGAVPSTVGPEMGATVAPPSPPPGQELPFGYDPFSIYPEGFVGAPFMVDPSQINFDLPGAAGPATDFYMGGGRQPSDLEMQQALAIASALESGIADDYAGDFAGNYPTGVSVGIDGRMRIEGDDGQMSPWQYLATERETPERQLARSIAEFNQSLAEQGMTGLPGEVRLPSGAVQGFAGQGFVDPRLAEMAAKQDDQQWKAALDMERATVRNTLGAYTDSSPYMNQFTAALSRIEQGNVSPEIKTNPRALAGYVGPFLQAHFPDMSQDQLRDNLLELSDQFNMWWGNLEQSGRVPVIEDGDLPTLAEALELAIRRHKQLTPRQNDPLAGYLEQAR